MSPPRARKGPLVSLFLGMKLRLDHKEDQGRGALPQTAAGGAEQVPRGARVSEVVKVQPGGLRVDRCPIRRRVPRAASLGQDPLGEGERFRGSSRVGERSDPDPSEAEPRSKGPKILGDRCSCVRFLWVP